MATLLLAASDARAGSYSGPVYSGGTYHGRGGPNGAEGDYNDGPKDTGWGGSGNSVTSASAAGTISATFTWQPAQGQTPQTDPPPPSGSVIITETSTAGAGVRTSPNGSCQAACDDGFGLPSSKQTQAGAPQYSPPPNPVLTGYAASVQAKDTRYTPGGGAVISLSATPSAMAGVSSSYSTNAIVSYTASISPVTISLGGPAKDGNGKLILDSSGNPQILVGQKCTATLAGIPSALLNNTLHKPVYEWSVDGSTFQRWTVAADQSTAKATYGIGNPTQSSVSWYWSDSTQLQLVSCKVTLTPPAGQGPSFVVNASQFVDLDAPTWSASEPVGLVQVNANYSPIDGQPGGAGIF